MISTSNVVISVIKSKSQLPSPPPHPPKYEQHDGVFEIGKDLEENDSVLSHHPIFYMMKIRKTIILSNYICRKFDRNVRRYFVESANQGQLRYAFWSCWSHPISHR